MISEQELFQMGLMPKAEDVVRLVNALKETQKKVWVIQDKLRKAKDDVWILDNHLRDTTTEARLQADLARELRAQLVEAREVIQFYSEPFTWSRVFADYHASVPSSGTDKMYGEKARAYLEKYK